MSTKRFTLAALVISMAALAGCATEQFGPTLRSTGTNSEASTRIAVIDSVTFGTMPKDTNGTWQAFAGQVVGGIVGGVAGNQVGGKFQPVATAAGAVGGAYMGSKIQASAGEQPAVRLTYTFERCKDDCTKTVTQPLEKGTEREWRKGARVRVVYGNGTHVVPL